MTTGWKETLLGEVLTERRETPTPESLENGEVSIVSKIGFNKGKIELRSDGKTKTGMILIRPGDLVVSGINAAKGAIAIYDEKETKSIAATIHYGSYIPNKERIEIKYLWWFLRSAAFREIVQHHVPGGIKTELKAKRFLSVPIPLPPLNEQKRILKHVEALSSRIAKAYSLREEADYETEKYSASMAKQVFSELASKHEPIPIGKTFNFRLDLIRPTDGKSGKVRFIGLQHVESNTGRRIGEDNLRAEDLTGRKFYFSPGEIVYGYLRPYLNKVWIADCEGICSVDQYVIRPNSKVIDTSYLAHFMRSPVFLERAIELTHNLLLPRLRSGLFGSIQIPVPPLDEQRRIVAYLDSVQARLASLRELQSATGEELDALLPSVLDRAFKGEL